MDVRRESRAERRAGAAAAGLGLGLAVTVFHWVSGCIRQQALPRGQTLQRHVRTLRFIRLRSKLFCFCFGVRHVHRPLAYCQLANWTGASNMLACPPPQTGWPLRLPRRLGMGTTERWRMDRCTMPRRNLRIPQMESLVVRRTRSGPPRTVLCTQRVSRTGNYPWR